METLLAKYLAKPTAENAKRVAAYDRKHPFAASILVCDLLAMGVLKEARAVAASMKKAA